MGSLESQGLVSNEKKHGFWLSALLIFMVLSNALGAGFYVMIAPSVSNIFPKASASLIYFQAFLGLVNLACAFAIWNWRKLGVYGFFCTASLVLFINIYIGVSIASTVGGIFGPLIIYAATRSKWHHFA